MADLFTPILLIRSNISYSVSVLFYCYYFLRKIYIYLYDSIGTSHMGGGGEHHLWLENFGDPE